MDLFEFEDSLVYKASSRTARTLHRETLSRKTKNKQMKKPSNLCVYSLTARVFVVMNLFCRIILALKLNTSLLLSTAIHQAGEL